MLPIAKASSGEDLLQCPESKDQMSQPNLDVDLLPKSMHEQILESLLEDNLRSGIHTDLEPANRSKIIRIRMKHNRIQSCSVFTIELTFDFR
jgi:predicted flavoprotein YhiN